MNVEIVPIPADRQHVLFQLWQLYVYDFSEMDGGDVGEDGRYASSIYLGEYWRDPRRHPYVVRVDGKLAGFVLVHRRERLADDPGVTRMAEFFIMRKYRRRGSASWSRPGSSSCSPAAGRCRRSRRTSAPRRSGGG